MLKSKIALAAVVSMVLAVPALAQTDEMMMKCDDAEMSAMNTKIEAMPDGESKTMAMKQMDMAKDSMSKQDMKECAMHMNDAMGSMEKK
jgi:hypothetical protein